MVLHIKHNIDITPFTFFLLYICAVTNYKRYGAFFFKGVFKAVPYDKSSLYGL